MCPRAIHSKRGYLLLEPASEMPKYSARRAFLSFTGRPSLNVLVQGWTKRYDQVTDDVMSLFW